MTEAKRSDSMSTQQPRAPVSSGGSDELRTRWGWILGLGILLEILGILAFGSVLFVSTNFLGWILIASGLLRGLPAMRVKCSSGYFIDVVTALLYVMVGVLVVIKTGDESTHITITFAIALLLILDGILQIANSFMTRYPNWRWLLVNGMLVLLFGLGLAIWQQLWRQMPHVRIWAIAGFLGITMLINGWSLLLLGWAGKKLRD